MGGNGWRPARTAAVALVVLVAVVLSGCTPLQPHRPVDDWPGSGPLRIEQIRLRDPFVVADRASGWYYLVGTGSGFPMYRSRDLSSWYGPKQVFTPPPGFWGTNRSWAPEVHRYRGRWYLFGSFADTPQDQLTASSTVGTAVLVANRPDGPYRPLTNGPVTPQDRFALDGTLLVDHASVPWLVYSHEWIDPRLDRIGQMEAVQLSADLARPVGEPVTLFTATSAPWANQDPIAHLFGGIVDGPWLHRTCAGDLLMLWSSFSVATYTTGVARSTTGRVTGPWAQLPTPFFSDDGGHASLFEGFDGVLRAVFHAPNRSTEHPVITPVSDAGGTVSPTTLADATRHACTPHR